MVDQLELVVVQVIGGGCLFCQDEGDMVLRMFFFRFFGISIFRQLILNNVRIENEDFYYRWEGVFLCLFLFDNLV